MAKRPPTRRFQNHVQRQLANWQHGLLWVVWSGFLAICAANSHRSSMGLSEFFSLIAAIAIHVLCVNFPAGQPRIEVRSTAELRGEFVSCTNWAIAVLGLGLTLVGVAMTIKLWQDLASGRTTLLGVLADCMVVFSEVVEESATSGRSGDVTHAQLYILVFAAPIGLVTLFVSLLPFIFRGSRFRITEGGQVAFRRSGEWRPLNLADIAAVAIDGITIDLTPTQAAQSLIRLPRQRVYSRQSGAFVRPELLGDFFREKLRVAGFKRVEQDLEGTEKYVADRLPA